MQSPERPLNPRQRLFCEIYVSGRPAGRAYEEAGYDLKGARADESASRLLRTNVKVAKYVAQLREQSSEDCRWTRKRALDYLCGVLETPIGDIGPDHVLAQEHQAATDRAGERIRMPAKIDAFRELAKMCGWYEAEKTENKLTIEYVKSW